MNKLHQIVIITSLLSPFFCVGNGTTQKSNQSFLAKIKIIPGATGVIFTYFTPIQISQPHQRHPVSPIGTPEAHGVSPIGTPEPRSPRRS